MTGTRLLAVATALLAMLALAGRKSAAEDTGSKTSSAVPTFSHKAHAERADAGRRVDVTACITCHASSTANKPPPTTRGHAPCMNSGCHIDQFLSTGPRTKKEDPAAYKSAALFCASCHKSKSGEPPSRFAKAKADALYQDKIAADYHVEMDHLAHTELTACSTCHQVAPDTFELVAGGPNHQQCATCHEGSEQPMTNCASCHTAPGPSEYFTKTRKASDVRVCAPGTEDGRPCFRHERTEHRFLPDQSADKGQLECSSCHFMFKKKSHQGMSYQTLADVKAAPMMHNKRDLAHKSCGVGGCHKREVDDSLGTGKCTQCHSAKFMANSLTD